MKAYCLNKISKIATKRIEKNIVDKIEDCDAIIVRSAKMHEMDLPANVLTVARAGAGVNNIPLAKYAEAGVVVFNTPGANANAVKELAICGLLIAARDVVGGINWVAENKSNPDIATLVEANKSTFGGTEIMGKTLGVIGLGVIGVMVANACQALGMNVIGYDPFLSVPNAVRLDRGIRYVTKMDEIYANCDYISIHVPLNPNTKKMINADSFKAMKKNVVILNFARDLLVDEDAMAPFLDNGKIAKYVTDFPNPTVSGFKNVIAIPHLGASTEEAEDNSADMAINQVVDYLENGNIINSVNYPMVDMGVKTSLPRICICHRNVSGMINQITDIMTKMKINIPNMVNKSAGEYAYSLLDVEYDDVMLLKEAIEKIDGVLKVRVI